MSKKTSVNSQQALLTNLRHFRFQKKATAGTSEANSKVHNDSADEQGKPSTTGNIVNSSTSDGGNKEKCDNSMENKSPNKNALSENAIKALKEVFPTLSGLVLERSLIRCKGDLDAAKVLINNDVAVKSTESKNTVEANQGKSESDVGSLGSKLFENLNKKCLNNQGLSMLTALPEKSSPVKRTSSEAENDSPVKTKKIKRDKNKIADFESGDSDDDIKYKKQDSKVFDSDEDSDVEVSNDMNTEQQEVYDFLSTATLSELMCMPHCSQKKAESIIEQRPFTGWRNMVEKFQEGKNLGTEILNSAQEVLYTRQVVNQLMQKCSRLAVEMERSISMGTSNVTVQPKLLSPSLKLASYQMVGLNWLLVLHHRRLNGILADEMGLGKTIQIIAFLAQLREMAETGEDDETNNTNLIVVPASTLDNWRNELEKWCPSLKVMVYYGSLEDRKMIRIQFSQQGIKDFDVVLTTYNLITSTPEERKMFKVLAFNYVIFDEAHMLKNMKTQRFENLMRVNAKRRILLTGTPLQNNLLELMSLLTFVMPEMFVNKKEYLKCLFTKNIKTKTNEPNDVPPKFEQEKVAQAKKIMQPFVLRRLKKDVLKDLPKKTESVIYCDMTEKQRARYTALISTFSKRAEKTGLNEEADETNGISMMMDLRKLSNHPLLLREFYDEGKIEEIAKVLAKEKDYKEKNVDYIREDLEVLSDFQIHELCKTFKKLSHYELNDELIVQSGKFQQLDKMLPELKAQNHRVLIFSQFVLMLNIIEEYLNIKGYKFLRLDGSTQVIIRQELIDTFNEDPSIFVFILSTRAGGLGINLTAADTVIIHDIDFNPYNDKQAEDRCHRVGQTRPVSVTRFISKNTIEEGIYQIALEKLSLEREISSEEGEQTETKSVVSLLRKALGMEGHKSSPQKKLT
ncbi:hypothetical protein RUM43_005875 [Polyplax serrata]|uniref:SWI/SNF-related matrix-associated actin-dependent regulator of chromatin subfamily A containing DEAD/H box 1 homolog n=1 Tax=Polyplax serrata TaxID=468196 RepID=A0AAN8PA78_POLSC